MYALGESIGALDLLMTLPAIPHAAILHAAIPHAAMLTQSGRLVFRGNFLIKLTLSSKKEETKKQTYSFSLLSAKS